MLVFSIFIICIAHIIRVFRWELLIEAYEKPDGIRLTKSLSLGYFLNYFLPFKIGDLARALFSGKGMQNGRGFALATVIVERCLDILVVGVLFILFSVTGTGGVNSSYESSVKAEPGTADAAFGFNVTNSGYYITLAACLFVGLLVVYVLRKYIKKLIFVACGLLNEKYEEKMLRFFWALIWGFKDILNRLPKIKLLLYTILMWGLYLCSYSTFSMFLENYGLSRSFGDVFFSLFDQKSLLSSGLANGFSFSEETIWYALFMLLPLVILYAIAVLWDRYFGVPGVDRGVADPGNNSAFVSAERLNLIPQANTDERRTFLKMYFAGEKKEYIENYLKINRNILVLRDYSAGSNATTILCTDGEQSFYRKYAFQEAAKKLEDQIEWLEKYGKKLPLTDIIRKEVSDGVCYYDMPYYSEAVTLFEYCQSGEKEKAWEVIKNTLLILEENLYRKKTKKAPSENQQELLEQYVDSKIIKNFNRILADKGLSELLKYDKVVINGVEYNNLRKYSDIISKARLMDIFKKDKISGIHGDLTIENIVCMRNDSADEETASDNDSPDFYLIDPNTGNIFDSKFIDYAKLLQSLHGKYEFLMAVDEATVSGNHIDYKYVESETYSYLYDKYRDYLKANFKEHEIKSIYYHEIANWLRLMPYKLEKGRGEVFFAGLIKILDDLKNIEDM